MAKLPDISSLGQADISRSGRPVASIDVSGYAKGAAALAKAEQGFGQEISQAGSDVASIARTQAAERSQLEEARARADYQINKTALDESLRDDQDYNTIPKRYRDSLSKIQADAAGYISDPRKRELFNLSISPDMARSAAAADNHANAKWKDATVADSTVKLDGLRDSALKSTDPAERVKSIDIGNQIIDSLVASNAITREAAVKLKQNWTQKYAEDSLSALPPQERISALTGFAGTLAQRESSGRPDLVNEFGYAGLYQFGAPRLADLGLYTPGPGESIKDSKSWQSSAQRWTGTFNIPGHPEVRTLADFLRSTDAQKIAFGAHDARMEQEIDTQGLGRFVGTSVNGVPVTREGIKAMAHLGGIGGARNVLEGKADAADAYGTKVSDYLKLGLRGDSYRIAQLLPENSRRQMLEYAQGELLQGDRSRRIAAQQAKDTSDVEEQGVFTRIHTDDQSLSLVDDILKNPKLTREAKERMTAQYESRATNKPDKLYGSAYFDLYQRIHLPADDPRAITDPSLIYPMVARDGKLSPAGADKLVSEMKDEPHIKEMKNIFFKSAQQQIVHANDFFHLKDPKGEEQFLKFKFAADKAYSDGIKSGKTPEQLLNPESKDYIGGIIPKYQRTPAQLTADLFATNQGIAEPLAGTGTENKPFEPKSLDELVAAYRNGQISKTRADQIAIDRGWAVRRPAVEQPPIIPMSQ